MEILLLSIPQSLRKINPILLLFLVILILEVSCVQILEAILLVVYHVQVLGFGNLATRDPKIEFFPTEEDYVAEHSQIIRFSLSALSFLVVAVSLVRGNN